MRAFSVQRVYMGRIGASLVLAAMALLWSASAEAACTSLTCPGDIFAETADTAAKVIYPLPTGTGMCTPEQASGLPPDSFFPLGVTTVSFRDKVDRGVSCSFRVTVAQINPAPALGVFGLGLVAAALSGFAIWSVRRRAH